MLFDDLTVEEQVLFMSELRKYYPKREVDLRSLFIKVVEVDEHTWTRLSFLRVSTRNENAFLFIGYNDCEFYIENES